MQTSKTQFLLAACGAAIAALVPSGPASAADPTVAVDDSGWVFTVAPYIWTAGLKGDVAAFGAPPIEIDASIGDVLKSLDVGLMGFGQARNGRFSVAADVFWVKLSDEGSTPAQVLFDKYDLTITNAMVTGVVGYSLVYEDGMNFDLVAGARYWSVDNNLALKRKSPSVKVSFDDEQDWVDPVVGFKATVDLSDKFFLTGWGLVGGFGVSSKFMWDANAAIGYHFSDWSSMTVGFRALGVNYENDGFEYDVTQYGPMMGFEFKF